MQISRRLAGVLVAVGVAVAAPLAVYATADAGTESLLSRGRPVIVSSIEAPGEYGDLSGANAVDGDAGTRWASEEGVDPQWITVDLGGPRTITRVRLRWEAAFARTYQIQTSGDGITWTTVKATTNGDGGTDELTGLSASGRFVRMFGTQRGTPYGYSLFELEVYGSGSGDVRAARTAGQAAPSATGRRNPPTASPAGSTATPAPPKPTSTAAKGTGLADPAKKDLAMQLVSSAENSSLDWKAQYAYLQDVGDGRGYTGGIIGFCSGTSDMLQLVELYTGRAPNNPLAKYLPALRKVNGSASHAGLEQGFAADWKTAATDPAFRKAQDDERDRIYFNPAVTQAKLDGLDTLGQFIYYDAIVMHGPGTSSVSFGGIRKSAMSRAKTPAQGGDQVAYLTAFLDARSTAMRTEAAHSDTTRLDTAQRVFLSAGNLGLNPPLAWKVYGDSYRIGA